MNVIVTSLYLQDVELSTRGQRSVCSSEGFRNTDVVVVLEWGVARNELLPLAGFFCS